MALKNFQAETLHTLSGNISIASMIQMVAKDYTITTFTQSNGDFSFQAPESTYDISLTDFNSTSSQPKHYHLQQFGVLIDQDIVKNLNPLVSTYTGTLTNGTHTFTDTEFWLAAKATLGQFTGFSADRDFSDGAGDFSINLFDITGNNVKFRAFHIDNTTTTHVCSVNLLEINC